MFANNRLSALIDSGKTPEQIHDRCEAPHPIATLLVLLSPDIAWLNHSTSPMQKYDGTDCIAALVPMKYVIRRAVPPCRPLQDLCVSY